MEKIYNMTVKNVTNIFQTWKIALAGTYKITTSALDDAGQTIKKSITINIYK